VSLEHYPQLAHECGDLMLSLQVGGVVALHRGAYGPVTVEFGIHGPESASWTMDPTFRHPLLRGNQSVKVFDGGLCIWVRDVRRAGDDRGVLGDRAVAPG
jgi:hypothetical protein